MKVILLRDVAKIGRKYEVKNVSSGHAMNFLIPKGLAEVATPSSLSNLEKLKVRHDDEIKVKEDLLIKNIKDIEGTRIEMVEKANELGHLFAGIHAHEIVPFIKEQTRLEILAQHIVLEKPIKEIGEHKIPVKIQDTTAEFTLVVTGK